MNVKRDLWALLMRLTKKNERQMPVMAYVWAIEAALLVFFVVPQLMWIPLVAFGLQALAYVIYKTVRGWRALKYRKHKKMAIQNLRPKKFRILA